MAFAIGTPQADVDASMLWGDLLIVGGGALWAATTLIVKATELRHAPPEKALIYQVVISIPILALAAYLSGETLTRVPGPLALSLIAYQAVWVVDSRFCSGGSWSRPIRPANCRHLPLSPLCLRRG